MGSTARDARLLELADANLAEATREMARWHTDHTLEESGDLLLVAGPHPFPAGYGNALMRLAPHARPSAAESIECARRFFDARRRGFTAWTRAHADADLEAACEASGLKRLVDLPGMVLERELPDAAAPAGIELRTVEDETTVRDFAEVAAGSYQTIGLPGEVTQTLFAMPHLMLRPHVLGVVAYRNGEPLSTALALLSHGIAGVYWVGTLEAGRRQGLGELCTRFVGNAAFRRGAACAVLQASAQGEPVYRRMGYREITRYRWYVGGRRAGVARRHPTIGRFSTASRGAAASGA